MVTSGAFSIGPPVVDRKTGHVQVCDTDMRCTYTFSHLQEMTSPALLVQVCYSGSHPDLHGSLIQSIFLLQTEKTNELLRTSTKFRVWALSWRRGEGGSSARKAVPLTLALGLLWWGGGRGSREKPPTMINEMINDPGPAAKTGWE